MVKCRDAKFCVSTSGLLRFFLVEDKIVVDVVHRDGGVGRDLVRQNHF